MKKLKPPKPVAPETDPKPQPRQSPWLAAVKNALVPENINIFEAMTAKYEKQLFAANQTITTQAWIIQAQKNEIERLEELLRLRRIQRFAASSEKDPVKLDLFDEAELEAQVDALQQQLAPSPPSPEALETPETPEAPETEITAAPQNKSRQRTFSDKMPRERIELKLSDEEKKGASQTFFKKVKEELLFLPALLKVLEYWQEYAVFEGQGKDGADEIRQAERPVHPLGKCRASVPLLAHIITSKYVDGMPLHRQEQVFLRLGQEVSRTVMANWVIGLGDVLAPLVKLFHQTQLTSHYLQADETRIQVLKEDGKTAQSDKWMWVIRGGPPDRPIVLFDYDPSRSGEVASRLLTGFKGTLQADGYSGYAPLCRDDNIDRIGCWDHARRKFVEVIKANPKGSKNSNGSNNAKDKNGNKLSRTTLAEAALEFITKLYSIEREIKDTTDEVRYQVRQEKSLPILTDFKIWLDANVDNVMKGSLTRKAMDYTLAQWPYLIGYCKHGYLNISNVLVENAIRPFALGRRAWLFADTSQGARASATCYSLVETAKANGLEPSAYIQYVLERIGAANQAAAKIEAEAGNEASPETGNQKTVKSLAPFESLLPWNTDLKTFLKKS